MDPLFWTLLVSLLLLTLNAYFVLAEFALVKVRASKVELMARKGDSRASAAQGMLQELDVYLSACQLGITMASLGMGWIGEPAVAKLLGPWSGGSHAVSFGLAFALITFLHIVLGELVPRSIAIQKADLVALWVTFPLRLFTAAFRIPITLMARVSIWILRLMRMGAAAEAESICSEEELRVMLGSSSEEHGYSLERLMLLENVFDLATAKVSEAMLPREKVAWLSLDKTWEENLAVVRERRFSRYPVCEENLDTAVGFVHVKDLYLRSGSEPPDLRALCRSLLVVSPSDSVQKLLRIFPDKGIHMALVREGKGPVFGIVTLEDLFEELVGEIHDEFDLPQAWALTDLLLPGSVEVNMQETDREAVLKSMLTRLKSIHPGLDYDAALKAVLTREAQFSSAVGHGVAIPHARLPSLDKPLLAMARAAKSFSFAPPDKTPVRLVFLILTPASSPVAQLRILARIAALFHNENLRRRVLRAKNVDRLMDILRTADTVLS